MSNLKINIFSGGNAFSSATAAKLTDEFNFSNNSKATVECIEVFLVSADDSCNELDRCKRILGCEELAEEFDFFVQVGPDINFMDFTGIEDFISLKKISIVKV